MSTNTSNTPIDSLDFNAIKENLKSYLQGQDQFKDYNFEGSALSVVLDLLAYNTHYQGYYANMAANESFLDSAVMRPSVISIAKHLNYVPRSSKAAQINVDIILQTDNNFNQSVARGNQFLPRYRVFTGKDSDGRTVPFVNLDTYKAVRRDGQNLFQDVVLYQGYRKQVSYVANLQAGTSTRFLIPDLDIDIDTVEVYVRKSQAESGSLGSNTTWKRATDINILNNDSRVFFVQNNREGLWEIYFGDGILGKSIENGNLITINYLVTDGTNGNGIGFNETNVSRAITISEDPRVTEVRIKRDSANRTIVSFGGRNPESVDSIKFYAPKNYQAQDRAVTSEDYRAILGKEYSDRADSFYVWGGEENDPPQYGKVFISIKPRVGTRLSAQEKTSIESTIFGSRNLLTITPEIVDPDILYINPTVTVYYDESRTTSSKEEVESGVITAAVVYSNSSLSGFDRNFRVSKFSALIDSLSPAITSNNAEFTLTKRIEPNLSRPSPYTIKFDNPLLHPIDGYTPILSSEGFSHRDLTSTSVVKPIVTCFLEDDGYGNIRIYKMVGNKKETVKRNVGIVNYKTGMVSLPNFFPESLPSGRIELGITVIPQTKDIFARRNQIILIESGNIKVTAIPEKTNIDRSASDAIFPR
jgi:hypothetical protein